jgi:hypothetical protein
MQRMAVCATADAERYSYDVTLKEKQIKEWNLTPG